MKVSIITGTYNSAKTIKDTIVSVLSQTYTNIEYIIIDGVSKDNTLDIVNSYGVKITKVISEKDKGIYDAMNKGVSLATGDIVGILNSDDFFTDNRVIERVVESFKNNDLDAVYGDIHFVNDNDLNKTVRYYSSRIFRPSLMRLGFMPAHPSFYVRRECYNKYGLFDLSYKIGADFELLLRFIKVNKIKIKYLNFDFVTMRTGGASTAGISSNKQILMDIKRALKENNIYTNMPILLSKYIYKVGELAYSKLKY